MEPLHIQQQQWHKAYRGDFMCCICGLPVCGSREHRIVPVQTMDGRPGAILEWRDEVERDDARDQVSFPYEGE